ELFEQDKPATVNNFIAYIKAGLWHEQVFHRWIPGFVLQGGSYNVPHEDDLMSSWTLEPNPITPFGTIPFEKDINRTFSNTFGTLAMARVGTDTNSASASWFFNLANNTRLDTQDGGFTVFGRTLRGTNALNRFVPPSGTDGEIFQIFQTDVPVWTEDPNKVDVFYITTDIVLLTAQIDFVRDSRRITWNSVAGLPNIVEFTRTIPAVWEPLQTITGTGQPISVLDSSQADAHRIYRVRINYGL
ncbi:MAG TPA: peptidylprolyl isomerase, partial [Verrucomicrobiae bacterium]|nr:peptidylprolyl isomerase [Verrucomicrobiae bacterium]